MNAPLGLLVLRTVLVVAVRRQRNPDFGASDMREAFQLIRFMVMRTCCHFGK
jgi:hypothetical protein